MIVKFGVIKSLFRFGKFSPLLVNLYLLMIHFLFILQITPKNRERNNSGVARGIVEARSIFLVLFNKFGPKIWVKKIVFTTSYTNFKVLPTSLNINLLQTISWKRKLHANNGVIYLIWMLSLSTFVKLIHLKNGLTYL